MRFLCILLVIGVASVGPGARAAVLGPGEPLTVAFVTRLIEEGLATGAGNRLAIAVDKPRLPLGNQSRQPTEITLHGLRLDEWSGRIQAALVGVSDDGQRFSLPLRARATPLVEVPVLNRTLEPGEIVGAADVDWQELPARRLPRQALLAADDLIGSEARRRLRAHQVLKMRDVGPPLLVRRGRPVRLVFRSAGLEIVVLGTAQDDGGLGASVRVLNEDSRRQVQGAVSGPDEVTVRGVMSSSGSGS